MAFKKSISSPFVIPCSSINPGMDIFAPDIIQMQYRKDNCNWFAEPTGEVPPHTQQTFARISIEMAQFPDRAFDRAMTNFNAWWHNLHQGVLKPYRLRHLTSATTRTSSMEIKVIVSMGKRAWQSKSASDDEPTTQQAFTSKRNVAVADTNTLSIRHNGNVVLVGHPRLIAVSSVRKQKLISNNTIKVSRNALCYEGATFAMSSFYYNEAILAYGRWGCKKPELDVKMLEKIQRGNNAHHFALVPVNFGGAHWACLVVEKSKMQFCDSMSLKKKDPPYK
ncbi:LOW QUALITY PROTEIN: hypothetical protein PHPALM_28074 [Phytophthora palmivora]|uniref:Ubiquitin-like protease family profile domain-containing protein n=1 Tax=Phytophthora palmivora TaxID=4796 RepID=A0A2P4XB17_9STRA|nr:LOW QUALITY PROTEIN: hypothetical protein PHPALM_28074 [Phytophthora palmivora]